MGDTTIKAILFIRGPYELHYQHFLRKLPESGTQHQEYQNHDSAQELLQTPQLSGKQRTTFLVQCEDYCEMLKATV